MPRTYIKKGNKAKWSPEQLQNALQFIEEGHSIRSASKKYQIPFSTLQERKSKNKTTAPRMGRQTTLSLEEEAVLANRIKYQSDLFYGVSPQQVRRITYEYVTTSNIKHNFSHESKMAGKDWFYAFLRRNPTISLRKPEATSINRITAFNREEVAKFYTNLETVMSKTQYLPNQIYNVDETGISTVQDPGTIVATKGKKRIGSVTSWERGKTITVICCMNGAGGYLPPFFIFPRKRMSPLLSKGGPPCAAYKCSHNGWSNEELFYEWIEHFITYTKCSKENPALLVLDNHSSHISLQTYNLCREKGICMLSLPPHASHRMQPLDVTLYGPLKAAFRRECDLYIKSKVLVKITPYDLAELFNKAYSRIATMAVGISGFQATGIHPVNPNIFTDQDFLAADTFNNRNDNDEVVMVNDLDNSIDDSINAGSSTSSLYAGPSNRELTSLEPKNNTASSSPSINSSPKPFPIPISNLIEAQPSTSKGFKQPVNSLKSISASQFYNLLPVPSASPTNKKSISRAKQHSQILTESPLKTQLEEQAKKKKEKIEKGNKKEKKEKAEKGKKPKVMFKKKKGFKKNLKKLLQSDSSDEEKIDEKTLCQDDELDDMESEQSNEICLICEEFGRDGEMWYRCIVCAHWIHELCSGWDTAENFKCDICLRK